MFSQSYKPLLQSGNKWHVIFFANTSSPCASPVYPSDNPYVYKIDGDSIVNGKTYKKIYCNPVGTFPLGQHRRDCNDYFYNYPLTSKGYFMALLREDISQKKIYKNQLGTINEDVLYDFSLQVNDVADISHYDVGLPPNIGFEFIGSIDYGTVFNQANIKRFTLGLNSNNQISYTNSSIYEGIGSYAGLLENPYTYSDWQFGNQLQCFEDVNGQSCSAFYLSTKDNQMMRSDIQLYYSKLDKTFKIISSEKRPYTIDFYDFSGRLIEEKKMDSNSNFIIKNPSNKLLLYTIDTGKIKVRGKIYIE